MNEPLPPASFVNHRQMEFALVTDLERLRTLATGLRLHGIARDLERARASVASHRFSIAVVGEFKRGKSTFINALIGKEILPADIAPTSATINRLTYGLRPLARIAYKDGTEQIVDVTELAGYVTKLTPEARARAATIEEAIIEYPVPFCKHNVDILDTPGLGDEAAMTAVTLSVLPRVDAAIFVTLATAPFAQSEAAFVDKLLLEYGLGSVLFVVTAIDRLRRTADRGQIVSTVTDRIERYIRQHAAARFGEGTEACERFLQRVGRPRVFGVSGYDALVGKMESDHELLAESRFPEFEEFLERFLTEESGLVALQTHAERLATLAEALRREVAVRLASSEPASDPIAQESHRALLRAAEWLGQDAANRLQARQRETEAERAGWLESLPTYFDQAAATCLADIPMTADDLEPRRTTAFVRGWAAKLTDAMNEAAAVKARECLAQLEKKLRAAVDEVVRFALVFDRLMRHLAKSREGLTLSRSGSDAAESMVARLGATSEFDRTRAASGAVAAMITAGSEQRRAAVEQALRVPPTWANGVEVPPLPEAGFTLVKKPFDFIRIEKFKVDLRAKLSAALSGSVQMGAAGREESLRRQIAEAFLVLGRQVQWAHEEIRAQEAQLEAVRQRRIASVEHECRRLEQVDAEVHEIYVRAKESTLRLNALQFAVAPHLDVGSHPPSVDLA